MKIKTIYRTVIVLGSMALCSCATPMREPASVATQTSTLPQRIEVSALQSVDYNQPISRSAFMQMLGE